MSLSAISQDFIACNRQLSDLGITNIIQPPKICVVGDQSSGKSSLVESLSLIKVPRDEGTCTRCPLQINISGNPDPDASWKCRISLLQQYEFNNNLKDKKPSDKRLLGPWSPSPYKEVPFVDLENPEQVCGHIRQAQAAILNPSANPAEFLPGSKSKILDEREVNFSPNTVRVDVSQPGYHDLSFTDLPGVINNHPTEQFLIKLITNLVTLYVKQEHTLVLFTLPMSADIANSSSKNIIQEHNAEMRTVVVLTKPDVASKNAVRRDREEFSEILRGANDGRQYLDSHVVLMQTDHTITNDDAFSLERTFFEEEPWFIKTASQESKLGVPALADKLQNLLQQRTRDRLPNIQMSIKKRTQVVDDKLKSYPEPIGEQQLSSTLVSLLQSCGSRLTRLFEGEGSARDRGMVVAWDTLCKALWDSLKAASPILVMSTEDERASRHEARSTIAKSIAAALGKCTKTVDLISDDDSPLPSPKSQEPASEDTCHKFTLEEINELNQAFSTLGLPDHDSPRAIQEMQRLSVQVWDCDLDKFITETSKLLLKHVNRLIVEIFGNYRDMPLFKHAQAVAREAVKKRYEAYMVHVRHSYDNERTTPYTLNGKLMAVETKNEQIRLSKERQEYRIQLETAQRTAAQPPQKNGHRREVKVEPYQLAEDAWRTEVRMMAQTCAYYTIASSRFVDMVCQGMRATLFASYADYIKDQLDEDLKPMSMDDEDQDRLIKLMTVNPENALKRRELIHERKKLIAAQELVERVLGGDGTECAVNGGPMTPATQKFATPGSKRSFGLASAPITPTCQKLAVRAPTPSNKRSINTMTETPETKRVRRGLAETDLNGDVHRDMSS